jgi:hypothetical protein
LQAGASQNTKPGGTWPWPESGTLLTLRDLNAGNVD